MKEEPNTKRPAGRALSILRRIGIAVCLIGSNIVMVLWGPFFAVAAAAVAVIVYLVFFSYKGPGFGPIGAEFISMMVVIMNLAVIVMSVIRIVKG